MKKKNKQTSEVHTKEKQGSWLTALFDSSEVIFTQLHQA